MATSAAPLHYSPREIRPRHRVRRIGFLIVVLATGVLVFHERDEIRTRAERRYWWHRCASFVVPAKTTLAETDPEKMKYLLATNPEYVADGTQYPWTISKVSPPAACYWPQEFRIMRTELMASVGMRKQAIAFMGERVSAGGNHRFVVVPIAEFNRLDLRVVAWETLVYTPPTLLGGRMKPCFGNRAINWSGRYEKASLSPGVADSLDQSRINLHWISDDHHLGTIDIYLQNDDSIKVEMHQER